MAVKSTVATALRKPPPSEETPSPLSATEQSLSGKALEAVIISSNPHEARGSQRKVVENSLRKEVGTLSNKDEEMTKNRMVPEDKERNEKERNGEEEERRNPFLDMFNDSMFTKELTETLEKETEKSDPALDTSWGLKIEVW